MDNFFASELTLVKGSEGTLLVQLIESYRNAQGQPRQRVIASLGDAHCAVD